MKFIVTIVLDNVAFETPDCGTEVASLLRQVADVAELAMTPFGLPVGKLGDSNGNGCVSAFLAVLDGEHTEGG